MEGAIGDGRANHRAVTQHDRTIRTTHDVTYCSWIRWRRDNRKARRPIREAPHARHVCGKAAQIARLGGWRGRMAIAGRLEDLTHRGEGAAARCAWAYLREGCARQRRRGGNGWRGSGHHCGRAGCPRLFVTRRAARFGCGLLQSDGDGLESGRHALLPIAVRQWQRRRDGGCHGLGDCAGRR